MTAPLPPEHVDLSTCAAEPIHIIGRIQSFGYLLAFSSDWIVTHASVNCAELLGRQAADLIGTPATDLFAGAALHEIRSRLQMLGAPDSVDRVFGISLFGDGRAYDLAVHASGRNFILEVEAAEEGKRSDYVGFVRPMVDRLRTSTTVAELCQLAARQLRGLTGFDRVMVYRFEHDGAGEVIAESRSGSVDSFLGLHFPESDIPAQARRLYTRNILRIISDVNDPTVPIVPATNPDGEPLDLSMSGLRAVSPIHIEYLKNMGIDASMSVSILRGGKLWGLMACHHYSPRRLHYAVRTAAELFGEFMSFLLDQVDTGEANQRRAIALRLHDEIMARVASGGSLIEAFEGFSDSIGKVIQFDAMAAWVGGELIGNAHFIDSDQFARFARFLNTTGASRIWHTNNLRAAYPEAAQFPEPYCGVLALPVSRSPRDYIVLFRREHIHSVSWAGNPEKPVELGPNGARLTPRKSFELWQQERHGYSLPWTEDEVASAESLRVTLLEVVLRMSEAAEQAQLKANRKQDILIAELNHRVRNLLNLVRSLVAQSQVGARSIDEFAEVLGDRIYALARAHDQVTKMNWSPASLADLIATECLAYVGEKADRLEVSGTDVLVEPSAFSSLALVFHELTTNSCKYGALSDRHGKVTVSIEKTADGGVAIDWQESGGPKVKPPERRGFGSSIIEQSIPHELNGETQVHYDPDGLKAHFVVPARHIAAFRSLAAPPAPPRPAPQREAMLSDDVLIIEDNMIIAMEAENILLALGAAQCHVAASVAAGLALARKVTPRFALLDVNLGDETSEPIAAYLHEQGIPFVVASGYGDNDMAQIHLAGAPAITKPYTRAQLANAISAAFEGMDQPETAGSCIPES